MPVGDHVLGGARDFDSALKHYREAQANDPQPGEASWGLALLHTQLGNAASALAACKRGLQLKLNPQQQSDLESLQRFLRPYAPHP